MNEVTSAFDPRMWDQYRARGGGDNGRGYKDLGWVGNDSLVEPYKVVAASFGRQIDMVDVGTGSGAVAEALGTFGRVFAFDISQEMLAQINGSKPRSIFTFQADAVFPPLPSETIDLITVRMVYHHLSKSAISESQKQLWRILKPGALLVVGEYVAVDQEVLEFEKNGSSGPFDIKEPGRHLWTGESLQEEISRSWLEQGGLVEDILWSTMPQYSVRDWMGKSGLSGDVQEKVLRCYLDAPPSVREKMGISYADGDALVNRPFASVVAKKPNA